MNKIAGKKILVVDDEPDIREILRDELLLENVLVTEAPNGRDAFESLQKSPVDIVISDLRMPGGDGLELLKRIKKEDSFKPVVIFVSGYLDLGLAEAMDLGADGAFPKPWHMNELLSALARLATPLEERCREGEKTSAPNTIEIHFSSWENALESGRIQLGRGGLFLAGSFADHFRAGAEARVRVTFDQLGPFESFSASGLIRWVRKDATEGLCSGLGFEFFSLPGAVMPTLVNWISTHKPIAFIPAGRV